MPSANTIQNIDPTILIDGEAPNQRVYLWWGSFGNLRTLELQRDMKTPVGTQRSVTGLTGFFEAPWVFERNGTYYMAYAGNNAGPTSQCTPANYHACIAYATASSPAGPWTYRGTVLRPVSSTTSHPGILEFNGTWYIAYHGRRGRRRALPPFGRDRPGGVGRHADPAADEARHADAGQGT